MTMTPICFLGTENSSRLYVKREDLLPFSFGGNKARKAELFFEQIDRGGYDSVITYGSSSSNHCRVVANQCRRRGMPCWVISAEETSEPTYNSRLIALFGAEVITVPSAEVHETIQGKYRELLQRGNKPYIIEGGGHGDIGTEAYVQCYREIKKQEQALNVRFDYIFFASGTGTTQAGLVCGQLLEKDTRRIVGISIARKNPRGRNIVLDSIRSYMGPRAGEEEIQGNTCFLDEYTAGYGKTDARILETVKDVLIRYGMPLDCTYTGKAFLGMRNYLEKEDIRDKNILFIHTGGTPLFFDALKMIGG